MLFLNDLYMNSEHVIQVRQYDVIVRTTALTHEDILNELDILINLHTLKKEDFEGVI